MQYPAGGGLCGQYTVTGRYQAGLPYRFMNEAHATLGVIEIETALVASFQGRRLARFNCPVTSHHPDHFNPSGDIGHDSR